MSAILRTELDGILNLPALQRNSLRISFGFHKKENKIINMRELEANRIGNRGQEV